MTVRCRSAAGQSCLFVLSAALVLAKCFPATATPVVNSIPSKILTSRVTSVSQLSDVSPSDWAAQALRSLIERYECISGYRDHTFGGDRTLTRYEFAVVLNACLPNLSQLTAADLATIRRLQDEFQAELTFLPSRVDALEVQAAELEANSFSTTTKLTGQVIFALTDVLSNERAVSNSINNSDEDLAGNTVLSDRVRLQFNSSFTGSDILGLEIEAGNTPNLGESTGTNMARLAFDQGEGNDLALSQLFYQFPIGNSANAAIVLNGQLFDFVDTVNPLVGSDLRGSVSRFGVRSPIYRTGGGGAGASLSYDLGGFANLALVYLASDASDTESGIFAGAYAALGQLTLKPNDNLSVGLTYLRSYNAIATGTGSANSDAPFDTNSSSVIGNSYGLEASWRVNPSFTLSGWLGLTTATALDLPETPDAEIFHYAVNFAFPDLGNQGSLLGIAIGQPPKVTSNDLGLIDSDTSLYVEAFYRFQVNDSIFITPGFVVVTNPEHNSSNDTICVGTIRTTFTF